MYNTCVIKNIDTETHIVLGVELLTGQEYEIPDSKRIMASNNDAILTGISSGIFQIGNGSSFYQTIGSQINYLKSGIKSVSLDEVSVSIPSKTGIEGFRLSRSNSDLELTTSYQDILNISGSGDLFGFKFIFSNDDVNVRLEVNSVEIFEIPTSELRSMNYESNTNAGLIRFFGGDSYGEFEFFPPSSIRYSTSLKIQVKKTKNHNIKKEFHHIMYSED